MVNSQTIKEIQEALKLDLNVDKVPSPIPVVEVNPKVVKNAFTANSTTTNATSTNMSGIPTDVDVYIVSASLSVIKDATSQSVLTSINYNPADKGSSSTQLIAIPSITLTAQTQTLSVTFPHPIKIKRGTVISVVNSNATANISAFGSISYFTDEVK